MAKTVNTNNLGYLGSEYQLRLVKCFIEDQQFFISLYNIIDQNMFTDEQLRRIVALMKDRYGDSETVPTYNDIEVLIRSKVSDAITVEQSLATIAKMRNISFDAIDLIEEEAEKFFKQQNLSKALNKASDIIKKGNASDYYLIEDMIKRALETNTKQDYGFRLFENVESDLNENYRQTISTGCKELDESLYGGLGKGELGLIIAPLGTGKAQPLTSKILTPNGFINMGDIKIGDEVIGRDGQAYKVTGVFPQGKRPVYKLTFSDNSIVECDINHLWYVRKRPKMNNIDSFEECVIDLTEIITSFNDYVYSVPKFEQELKQNNPFVIIKTIEYVREDYTQCIMIDSDEHLYVTDDFIVTHNTSISTGFAASAATHKCELNNYQGFKVLHFFFEDEEVTIRRKYYGYMLDIDACDLSRPEIRPIAIQRLSEDSDIKQMLKNNIISKRLCSGEVTASQIKNMIKQYISIGFKPDLVIIDYFECLKAEKGDSMSDTEWTREGVSMRKLESICNELKIAIWCPIQGTKGSIGVDTVTLQHAGGSVKKTQIGHIVLTLAQTDEQKENGRLNLFIGKLRAAKIGRTSFKNVKFNNGTGKFDMSDIDDIENSLNSSGISNAAQNIAKSVKQEYRRNYGN